MRQHCNFERSHSYIIAIPVFMGKAFDNSAFSPNTIFPFFLILFVGLIAGPRPDEFKMPYSRRWVFEARASPTRLNAVLMMRGVIGCEYGKTTSSISNK